MKLIVADSVCSEARKEPLVAVVLVGVNFTLAVQLVWLVRVELQVVESIVKGEGIEEMMERAKFMAARSRGKPEFVSRNVKVWLEPIST